MTPLSSIVKLPVQLPRPSNLKIPMRARGVPAGTTVAKAWYPYDPRIVATEHCGCACALGAAPGTNMTIKNAIAIDDCLIVLASFIVLLSFVVVTLSPTPGKGTDTPLA